MKRMTIKALAVLAVLAALAVVPTTSKHGVPAVYAFAPSGTCTNSTLTGNYAVIQPAGFASQGPTTGSEVPWQFMAVVDFHGDGTLDARWTAAFNGAISGAEFQTQPQKNTGAYTVESDCTGFLTLDQGGNDPGATANIVVIGSGAEIFGIWTTNGATATFDAKKM